MKGSLTPHSPPSFLQRGPWGSPTGSHSTGAAHWRSLSSLREKKSAMLRLRRCCCSALGETLCESSAPEQGRALGAYLCDRLLVPHGRLLDEAVDLYIPISARDDHPGPPETHRHFHFHLRRVNPNEEKAASGRRMEASPERDGGNKLKILACCDEGGLK
ncbi:hypothetical protein VZT92_014490 [Zoarces viviparus]|uniref:Uncharacterized protein n=1 Tax=Zoarces viviparus TaxID=48416 RepID=A0AAW1EZ76_ZOAVI